MEESKITTNSNSIRNILTLRYDPTLTSTLPKMNWKDFSINDATPSSDFVTNAIEKQLKNTIGTQNVEKIAVALSGGVDSTLIITLLRKIFPDVTIESVSVKFANSVDETQKAAKIAEHFQANHHIIDVDNYLRELPQAISIIKLPFWDLHWYYVAKKAKTLSKYLASGDGGDELFGGYTFRYEKFLSLTNSNSSPLEKAKAYLQCHERDRVPDQQDMFDRKSNFSWDSIYKILIPFFDNPLNSLEQVFLADYNGKLLYNFSIVNTAIHKHFGLTSLAPLLSTELISYSTHLSLQHKYDSQTNIGKLLLRKILKENNVDSFVSKEKLGFNVNTINLWKSNGKDLCNQYLLNSRIIEDGWINKQWVTKHINNSELNVKYVNKFLGLLAFEIWYRLFVTKEMKPNTTLN